MQSLLNEQNHSEGFIYTPAYLFFFNSLKYPIDEANAAALSGIPLLTSASAVSSILFPAPFNSILEPSLLVHIIYLVNKYIYKGFPWRFAYNLLTK